MGRKPYRHRYPLLAVHGTNASGDLPATNFTILSPVAGPPASGTDSNGNPASTNAALYPCPPTQAQINQGDTCTLGYGTSGGASASSNITFQGQGATLLVTPDANLSNGQNVEVTGSGWIASGIGALAECSTAAGQPTIAPVQIPVSCSDPSNNPTTANSSGDISTTFIVKSGVVGPPATRTDSSGGNAATDAASYPCPPTPTQISAGATCTIGYSQGVGCSGHGEYCL